MSKLRQTLLIIQREYLSRVKKKSFIITTLLIPIGFGVFFAGSIFLTNISKEKLNIIAIDKSGLFQDRIPDNENMYISFADTSANYLKDSYEESGYDGFLYIPNINIDDPKGIKFFSTNQLGIQMQSYLERELERKIEKRKLELAGLDQAFMNKLKSNVQLETIITRGQQEEKGNSGIATALGYVMGFIIYMVLIIYGTMVMRGVMEEKNNRIVEIIMSSVKPFQLMFGKVIGLAAVGLTQFMLWGVLIVVVQLFLGVVFGPKIIELQNMAANPALAPNQDAMKLASTITGFQNIEFGKLIGWFLFYFLGGYLLYASLFAAVGSLINDQTDTQPLTFPITMPIILSIFIMMTISENPNSSLVKWASFIPLSSPVIMPARIPFGVPTWEIVLSAVLLVLGFLGSIWLAGKIYRVGILMYGKKITMKELGKWVFYK